ncbi:MAG: hypothetical protein U0414_43485 [Polyangiaceae bacterium]
MPHVVAASLLGCDRGDDLGGACRSLRPPPGEHTEDGRADGDHQKSEHEGPRLLVEEQPVARPAQGAMNPTATTVAMMDVVASR